jgi:hypothetical protein
VASQRLAKDQYKEEDGGGKKKVSARFKVFAAKAKKLLVENFPSEG